MSGASISACSMATPPVFSDSLSLGASLQHHCGMHAVQTSLDRLMITPDVMPQAASCGCWPTRQMCASLTSSAYATAPCTHAYDSYSHSRRVVKQQEDKVAPGFTANGLELLVLSLKVLDPLELCGTSESAIQVCNWSQHHQGSAVLGECLAALHRLLESMVSALNSAVRFQRTYLQRSNFAAVMLSVEAYHIATRDRGTQSAGYTLRQMPQEQHDACRHCGRL